MRYFLTLLWLRLKATARSGGFLVSAFCFLSLTLLFGGVLPRQQQAGLTVGVLPTSVLGEAVGEILMKNGEYQVLPYETEDAMKRDILTGKLHCGYILSDEWTDMPPIRVLATDASYLRPITDQLVLSAYFQAKVPRMIGDYREELGYPGGEEEASRLIHQERLRSHGLEIEVRSVRERGSQKTEEDSPITGGLKNGIQPLLYTVMLSLFVTASLLGAMLSKEEERRALLQLCVLSGRRGATLLAPAVATALLNFILLLGAEGLLFAMGLPMVQGGTFLYPVLALTAAGFSMAGGVLRKHGMVVGAVLPVWLLISIVCSGALFDPKLLPTGLSVLRYFSPAWYLLG